MLIYGYRAIGSDIKPGKVKLGKLVKTMTSWRKDYVLRDDGSEKIWLSG